MTALQSGQFPVAIKWKTLRCRFNALRPIRIRLKFIDALSLCHKCALLRLILLFNLDLNISSDNAACASVLRLFHSRIVDGKMMYGSMFSWF